MGHAKPEHLKQLSTLLDEFRGQSALKEKSFGCFYMKSKSVLHFHTKVERLYAHVFDGEYWNEVDIKLPLAAAKQKVLSGKILGMLPL